MTGAARGDRVEVGPLVLVVMGVSGAGKTTVAKELARRLGWAFEEGDALHPAANVAKMHAGVPLTDADRQPWLEAVAAWIDHQLAAGLPGIITCSALKRGYRNIIIGRRQHVRLVYLRGDPGLLADRMANREGHFMPPSLLPSQLASLEVPGRDENPLIVDVSPPPDRIAESIITMLNGARTTEQLANTEAPAGECHNF
jgi:ribose 5-phosphate isomerase A